MNRYEAHIAYYGITGARTQIGEAWYPVTAGTITTDDLDYFRADIRDRNRYDTVIVINVFVLPVSRSE